MPTRLKDLAKETGYSISTISRALLGYKDVNSDTRRKIAEAAQKKALPALLWIET